MLSSGQAMKITVIRHSIRNRGGDKTVLDYCSFLAGRGHQVVYWTNKIATQFTIDPRIQIKRIPLPGRLGTILFAAFSAFRTDVILVDIVVMATVAALRNRRSVVYFAQDYDVMYYSSAVMKNFIKMLYGLALGRIKIPVISVSEELARELAVYRPGKIRTVPNGVDLEKFFRNPHSPYLAHRKSPTVIFVYARRDYRKGWDIAVNAFKELEKTCPSGGWEIWTIGDDSLSLNFLKAEVKKYGFVDESALKDILSATDIFLLPSRHEGLSLLLLQALACECAVVTTEAATIISHEVNGLVSPNEDSRSLAANIDRLLKDGVFREQLKKNARLLAQEYGLEKSCRQFEEAISSFP
jgi:glycosyltransferase involved in cell wall biosynthesis